jgi:Tfp pilus assembly protein PilO
VSFSRLWRAIREMDRYAVATVLLATLALGLYALAVRPLQSQAQALRERVAALESHTAVQGRHAEPARPASQLAVFYDQLPPVAQAPEVVRQLHAHAHGAGLALQRGEYRPLADASAKLVRYQIVLPVKGSYQQVRRFLTGAMRDMPELALDGIAFRRDKDGASQLDVELRFTAFLRITS